MKLPALFMLILPMLTTQFLENISKCRSLVAFIPARGGSKGIKNKNLSRIGNETLLSRAINTIQKSKIFRDIWVSTDHKEIAKEAKNNNVRVHWRHLHTASDYAPTVLAIQEFLHYHSEINYLAVIQVTSPFLCSSYLIKAAQEFIGDCAFAATRTHSLRWSQTKGGFAKAVNFDVKNRPRRQDWAGDLIENGMFYFTTRQLIFQGLIQNDRCKIIETDTMRSMEIDNLNDLTIARVLAQKLPPC